MKTQIIQYYNKLEETLSKDIESSRNILASLLFSFRGAIGRADYIYGIAYSLLFLFVTLDNVVSHSTIILIGGGIDRLGLFIIALSYIGLIFAIWSFLAVTIKRTRALGIEERFVLLAYIFPPLLLVGFMPDKEPYEYHDGFSLVDQIFFYCLVIISILCLFTLYHLHQSVQFVLFILIVLIGDAVYLFGKDRKPYQKSVRKKFSGLDIVLDLLFVLLIVFFIRSYIISPFQIIGPSMEPTFHGGAINPYGAGGQTYSDGEYIVVDKMSYRFTTPSRGDVVVFTPAVGPSKRYLIKRVIGLPGDKIRIENGYVTIATKKNPENFIRIDEYDYLLEKFGLTCLTYTSAGCESNEHETFIVPPGKYFLMGDNRNQSLDSRKCFWNSGCVGEYTKAQFVALKNIQGRVAYSLGHFDLFEGTWLPTRFGSLQMVIPWRGLGIKNSHSYKELGE